MKAKHFIGIDIATTTENSYCLIRKVEGEQDIILLAKTMKSALEFGKEVNNLMRYFDAVVIEEIIEKVNELE